MVEQLGFAIILSSFEIKSPSPQLSCNAKWCRTDEEFSTPNMYRTASGAPGPAYYQQQADYKMDIELDDENKKIYGNETITYKNNSPR